MIPTIYLLRNPSIKPKTFDIWLNIDKRYKELCNISGEPNDIKL